MDEKKQPDAYKLLMNSARLSVAQEVMVHGELTTLQLAELLPNIPKATLYRHVKTLENAGILCVVREAKIRGTVEKTYAAQKLLLPNDTPFSQVESALNSTLLGLMGAFSEYLRREDADPVADFLCFRTTALMLSDAEMADFMARLGTLIEEFSASDASANRKARQVTIISSP